MLQEEITDLQNQIKRFSDSLKNENNAVMQNAYREKIDALTSRLAPLLQRKRKILLNSVWLHCVKCGESFRGLDFYKAYDEQARKMHPAMTDEQRYKLVKTVMKEQGYWRKSASRIIENFDTGEYLCPGCNRKYTLEELELMYHQNKLPIAIAKVIVFFYQLTHKTNRK